VEKRARSVGLGRQVAPSHYYAAEYDTKGRWISYWHQIHEILAQEPGSVLEIGIGNGLVTQYLRERGLNVTSLDIDARLGPDCAGSVLDIPLRDGSFDVVACFEVLEHIPFDFFSRAVREILRVARESAVLSLPDKGRAYRVDIGVPKLGRIRRLLAVPKLRLPTHEPGGLHYWEIDKAGYPLRSIVEQIQEAGWTVVRTYRVFEMLRHRFFVLVKGR
jgi:SAM-dependent methyltransferase